MADLPRQIRLAAGDYFMHGQDRRMRQVGLPGNVCCAVIRLDQGLDMERLRKSLATSEVMDWLARVQIVRPLPVVPGWWRTTTEPRTILFEHNDQNGSGHPIWQLPKAVSARELHAARGPGLAVDVVRHADGTSHLYLSWNHTLLDARGLDLLMSHLTSEVPEKRGAAAENLIHSRQKRLGLAEWWPNVKNARGSVGWLKESGAEPLFSLVPAGARPATCLNRYRVITFNEEETARIDARCQQLNAGFRRSHVYLAASIRGVHGIAQRRGNKDGAYLIPVPHDTRRRGAAGPIFSNHLSILFYRIEPKMAGRIVDIMGELGRQMTNQIRDKFPEACMAALDMFKPLPLGFYVNHLGKPTRGKIATFSFSDSGETCAGKTELWGAKILEVAHLVPAWRPPGLIVVFLRFGGRLSAQVSTVDDCVSPAEVDELERDIRSALLEENLS
jgi:hypothetical protein